MNIATRLSNEELELKFEEQERIRHKIAPESNDRTGKCSDLSRKSVKRQLRVRETVLPQMYNKRDRIWTKSNMLKPGGLMYLIETEDSFTIRNHIDQLEGVQSQSLRHG